MWSSAGSERARNVRLPVGCSLVDADVAPAGGGEGFAVPAAPSFVQAEPGDAGHEVELWGVGQAEANRCEHDGVGADVDVVVVEDLAYRVVVAYAQCDLVYPDFLGIDELMARPGGGGGNPAFEHEHAAGVQVT